MCTLSVITRDQGYLLAMNRDERILRGEGTPPEIHELSGTKAMYPGDGNSGTWIGANEHGIALALLNWNDLPAAAGGMLMAHSRGQVIPALSDCRSLSELAGVLGVLGLQGMQPFRLVGVFPGEKAIREWHWDTARMESLAHAWRPRHWFSSSLSDRRAEDVRGAACQQAWAESDAGSAAWLRRLHASHTGGPGPFSICVHREEVKTLSYTEVECTAESVRMEHSLGSACDRQTSTVLSMGRLDELSLQSISEISSRI